MEKFLFTKSILKEKIPSENRLISVMSRHTLEDGITPDERIIEGINYDEWKAEFAPPAKLVWAYYRKEISWEEYEKKYLEFLRSKELIEKVISFAKRCIEEIIILECIEDTSEKCHRRILAEELQRHQSELKIVHL